MNTNKYNSSNEYDFIDLKGWWCILIWIITSIIVGIVFKDSLSTSAPDVISLFFSNYMNLISDKKSFLSVLLAFLILSPFFCIFLLLKGLKNRVMTSNSRLVLGIWILSGLLLNSDFVDYTNRTKFSEIPYQIIIWGDWFGAITVCIFLLLLVIISSLILVKNVKYN